MNAALLTSFIVIACMAFVKSDSNAELDAFSHACMAEAKVTEKEVEEFYSNEAKFNTATPNQQCHLKCVMEKLGEFKGGALDVDKTMKNWKEIPELAEFRVTNPKIFTDCKDEKGSNDCETAYKINKCIRKNKPAK